MKYRSHSASAVYNVMQGLVCNYDPSMTALALVLFEKQSKNENLTLELNAKFSIKQSQWTMTYRSHSASAVYNVMQGLRCNYDPSMNTLALVLFEKQFKTKT